MLIETTRFGGMEVDERRIITFPEGILGFPRFLQYALIETTPDPLFFWLQSVQEPSLAFVVCDPLAFVPDYTAPVRAEEVKALELRDLTDCQVLAIVNKVDGHLTANLQGPLVIGVESMLGKQLVLSEKRYSTRHRLLVITRHESEALAARRVG